MIHSSVTVTWSYGLSAPSFGAHHGASVEKVNSYEVDLNPGTRRSSLLRLRPTAAGPGVA